MLIRLSQPDDLAVSIEDVKSHVIIETADDDELLEGYIRAATRLAEDKTGRIFVPGEFELRLDRWCEKITIPAFPVREVEAISYIDAAGVERTLASAEWYLCDVSDGGEIFFTDAFGSPELVQRRQAIRVRFTAGYEVPGTSGSGDDPALKPDPMDRMIIMLLVANWYQSREPVTLDNSVAEVPFSVKLLIDVRKIYR